MVRVKICGITALEDARLALDAGADYLGFIFYPPSPRSIAPERAAEIVRRLRHDATARAQREDANPPRFVGVFVNEPATAIAAILDGCDLDLAQLSGDEEAAVVTSAESPLFGRAYKAVRPRAHDEVRQLGARVAAPLAAGPALLLDTPNGQLYGGSGETGDWTAAAALAAAVPRLMLAGGLTPGNVAEAIARVRPYAVDVASGVEVAPGRKDAARVRAFIASARSAG